ncbi:OmpA family protein [Acinetobacter sp. 187]|nr:OmpA family protein [Acinetobacter lanii]
MFGMATVGLAACSSNPYSQPNDLKFQSSSNGKKQNLTVIRDEKLCFNESYEDQRCPIKFYVDDIKAGEFFINNSAKLILKPETYNFKAKNCTDECTVCETEVDVSEVKDNVLHLSVDDSGRPIILDSDHKMICKTETNQPAVSPIAETKTVQINLAADTLFKFDGSTLNDLLPKGYQEVLNVASQVKQGFVSIKSIQLTGHTDRLGTEAYNLNLAAERAKTVSEILVQNGISKNIISTKSMGEAMPVTNGCYGVQPVEKLKACLQPDRRVTVEITGISK